MMSVLVHLISKVYAYITRFLFKFDKRKKTAPAKGCQTWFHSDIKFPLRQGGGDPWKCKHMQTVGKGGQGECSHIFLLSSYSINYLQRLPDFSLVTHQNCNGIVKALIPSFSQVAQRQNNFMLHSYLHVVNLTWLCLNHFYYQANLKLINLLKVKLSPYNKTVLFVSMEIG